MREMEGVVDSDAVVDSTPMADSEVSTIEVARMCVVATKRYTHRNFRVVHKVKSVIRDGKIDRDQ